MRHRTYTAPKTEAPFAGASTLQTQLNELMALMADWTAAMNDTYDIGAVLDAAQRRIETRSIMLYRLLPGALRPRLAARTTRPKGIDIHALPTGSLAEFLLDRHAGSALPGTVWRLSELRDDPQFPQSRACREWLQRPDTAEVTLMILGTGPEGLDLLELHFTQAPYRHDVIRAELLASALAHAWAKRQDGLCARLIVEQGQRNRSGSPDADRKILATDNPYNLSRSEFRICGLIGQGLRARDIAAELGLSETTIRTHLRNIYAKTDASGQLEVLSRLHTDVPHPPPGAARHPVAVAGR